MLLLLLEPNVGIVNVPDSRLDKLAIINRSVKVSPATVYLLLFEFCVSWVL